MNKSTYNQFFKNFLPILSLLIGGTFFIWLTNFDLWSQKKLFFDGSGWIYGNNQPWKFLYHYGNIPALIVSIGSLILFTVSFYRKKIALYRKKLLYLVLVMIIGPGLLINAIFKDNWGRPRPRHLTLFGGTEEYHQVWETGTNSRGKSFPCGHASMGFYLVVFYFLLREKKQKIANLVLICSIAYGTLIGFARMTQGGHFASDVLWSFGMTYLTALLLYKPFSGAIKDNIITEIPKRLRNLLTVILMILISMGIIAFLMATPYKDNQRTSYDINVSGYNRYSLNIKSIDLYLEFDEKESLRLFKDINGFGIPKSKVSFILNESTRNDSTIIELQQSISGFFSELNGKISVEIPFSLAENSEILTFVEIKMKGGNIYFKKELLERNRLEIVKISETSYKLLNQNISIDILIEDGQLNVY
ncbi:MAG: phosphatase PAP2 family protein [Candidatus Cloacimonetes bacterium]|nr:phosphatase PAP2 family protein [Candidatus Cloacimonadota bacterium]